MDPKLKELYTQWWLLRDDLRSCFDEVGRANALRDMADIERKILAMGGELP